MSQLLSWFAAPAFAWLSACVVSIALYRVAICDEFDGHVIVDRYSCTATFFVFPSLVPSYTYRDMTRSASCRKQSSGNVTVDRSGLITDRYFFPLPTMRLSRSFTVPDELIW